MFPVSTQLAKTFDELAAQVVGLAIEVQRQTEMVQTLSEGHDQNRRELQVATQHAVDVAALLDKKVAFTDELARILKEKIAAADAAAADVIGKV